MKKLSFLILLLCAGCDLVKPEPKITETAEYKARLKCADKAMRLYDSIADAMKRNQDMRLGMAIDLCISQMKPTCPACGKPYKNVADQLWCVEHFSVDDFSKYLEAIRATTKDHDVYYAINSEIELIDSISKVFKAETER